MTKFDKANNKRMIQLPKDKQSSYIMRNLKKIKKALQVEL